MREVYLDSAATTPVSREAAAAAADAMLNNWGNPSSRHRRGIDAEELLRQARSTLARALSAREDEIYFTSGGTEANNLAVLGAARAAKRSGTRVVISSIEHSSVMESAARLEKEGFEVIRLRHDTQGHVSLSELERVIDSSTVLVSMMLVNNELGTVLPVSGAADIIKRSGSPALLHCDAVQAFGKLPVSVRELSCDLLTVSGHKINAPKGVGALFCRRGVRLQPLCFGGEQQDKLRPGTEPLPQIAAFAEAVRCLKPAEQAENHYRELNKYARQRLESVGGIVFNSPEDASPCILNVSTGCIKSETMLNFLSAKNIFISSGSACAKGKLSHVLKAVGMTRELADSALRVSFGADTSREDIDDFVSALSEGVSRLAPFRRTRQR